MSDHSEDPRDWLAALPDQRGRDRSGRFLPGTSGNPAGRPAIVRPLRELARELSEGVVRSLALLASDTTVAPAARVAAARELLRVAGVATETQMNKSVQEMTDIELGYDDDEPDDAEEAGPWAGGPPLRGG